MIMKTIKGYKGFDKNLKCRDFQYEVGKEYQTDEVKICEKGFHFCENPIDVFKYYPPVDDNGNLNRFAEVEGSGNIDTDNEKISCTNIKINKEISLNEIMSAGIRFILSKVNFNDKLTNTGDSSAATNTGRSSAATNTGDYSAATNTGNYSAATNTGRSSVATNTGNYSAAGVSGKESIAIVTGKDSKAKGTIGSWIVLTERGEFDGNNYPIIGVKAFKVDGETIKGDTFYKLVNGEAVECK